MIIGDTVELLDGVKNFYRHSKNTHLTNATAEIVSISLGPVTAIKLNKSLAYHTDTYDQADLQLVEDMPTFEI